jgi:hypothetical protein
MITKITTASLLSLLIISQASADEKVTMKRKPGLWEVSVSAEGKSLPGAMKQCADEATDAQMMQMAQGQSESCKMGELTKNDSGYEFSSECQMGSSKISSKGVFKGDFETSYIGEVVTKIDPPVFGRGEAKSTIQAKWLGECPADMKPGDMQTGDGMKINLEQAKKGAQMAAEMMKNPEMLKAMKEAMAGAAEAQGALKGLGEMVAGGK